MRVSRGLALESPIVSPTTGPRRDSACRGGSGSLPILRDRSGGPDDTRRTVPSSSPTTIGRARLRGCLRNRHPMTHPMNSGRLGRLGGQGAHERPDECLLGGRGWMRQTVVKVLAFRRSRIDLGSAAMTGNTGGRPVEWATTKWPGWDWIQTDGDRLPRRRRADSCAVHRLNSCDDLGVTEVSRGVWRTSPNQERMTGRRWRS
jgi:hypothetical protein